MQTLSFNHEQIEEILRTRVSPIFLRGLRESLKRPQPPLVYTSFDGDLLSYSEIMKQFVLRRHAVPLNPEAALGTYLVVNHHKGNKRLIIEDCFSLLQKCDQLWIFSSSLPRSGELAFAEIMPEGVLAEALFWMKHKSRDIRFISIDNLRQTQMLTFPPEKFPLENLVRSDQKTGIDSLTAQPLHGLRKVVYLLAGEKHAKHSDWMREMAYQSGRVPLCPYTLINLSTLTLAYGKNEFMKMLARATLAAKADEIWIFSPFQESEFSLEKLETDALIELSLALRCDPTKEVAHIFFGESGVPKYVDRKSWALTDFEKHTKHD